MNEYQSRKNLKNSARELLRGHYPAVIITIVMVSFLSSGIRSASVLLVLPDNLLGTVLYQAAAILFGTLSGMFSIGVISFFLKICCRQAPNILDIFYGFMVQPKKNFVVSLFFTVLNFICSLPLLFIRITAGPENPELFVKENIIYLTVAAVCNILYTLVTLCFSQLYYVMLDFPDLSVKELFSAGIRLMRHNLGRYLMLEISFIPMLLLGVGSFSIGFLWIYPYIYTTHGLFYLDLVQKKATP